MGGMQLWENTHLCKICFKVFNKSACYNICDSSQTLSVTLSVCLNQTSRHIYRKKLVKCRGLLVSTVWCIYTMQLCINPPLGGDTAPRLSPRQKTFSLAGTPIVFLSLNSSKFKLLKPSLINEAKLSVLSLFIHHSVNLVSGREKGWTQVYPSGLMMSPSLGGWSMLMQNSAKWLH